MNSSSFYGSRLRNTKKTSLSENIDRLPKPKSEKRLKKRMVLKKAADVLFSSVTVESSGHQARPTVLEDLRPELARQRSEIEALRKQLSLCKAAHASETEALRKELHACKQACASANTALADLNTTHNQLVQTHTTVVMQLREAQTAATEAQRTPLPFCTPVADSMTRTGVTPNLSVDADRSENTPSIASVDLNPTPPGSCHPDLQFSPPTLEHTDIMMIQSRGRPDRYGCLLFRAVVPEQRYAEWATTTNWDGSRGKFALPMNIRQFVTSTVSQRFPHMSSADSKRIKDRVNEFLRSPRNSVAHRRLYF
ncbi:uncharacterized protein LOC109083330 [Cyprinus carpio]|uniref:Uncharacterized protein LOC109083330 n=1 Tax=Cyprinus carpio TaxID=7962 RepID=A0A9Q9ZH78_CYPCA|nr:uncharacterized protein LOC109083330 [Cyprinus carpio]